MQGTQRIVGGHVAPEPIPWQVNIMYRFKRRCGGTLIDQTTIITAAHCCKFKHDNGSDVILPNGYLKLDTRQSLLF